MRYQITVLRNFPSGNKSTMTHAVTESDLPAKLAECAAAGDVDQIHVVREPNPCAWKLGMSGGMGQ